MDGPGFDMAMREAFRVLRPGGRLAFSITHPCFMTKGAQWQRDAAGRKIKWMVGDYIAAGFVLTGLEEPRPSEEYCRAHPSQRGWRDHAALFLHVGAVKPA